MHSWASGQAGFELKLMGIGTGKGVPRLPQLAGGELPQVVEGGEGTCRVLVRTVSAGHAGQL